MRTSKGTSQGLQRRKGSGNKASNAEEFCGHDRSDVFCIVVNTAEVLLLPDGSGTLIM